MSGRWGMYGRQRGNKVVKRGEIMTLNEAGRGCFGCWGARMIRLWLGNDDFHDVCRMMCLG